MNDTTFNHTDFLYKYLKLWHLSLIRITSTKFEEKTSIMIKTAKN